MVVGSALSDISDKDGEFLDAWPPAGYGKVDFAIPGLRQYLRESIDRITVIGVPNEVWSGGSFGVRAVSLGGCPFPSKLTQGTSDAFSIVHYPCHAGG